HRVYNRRSPVPGCHARENDALKGIFAEMEQAATLERPLRVGVVGVGVMGSNHARVLAGFSGVELIAIADPDRQQADYVSRALGCATVGGVDELLELKPDAV